MKKFLVSILLCLQLISVTGCSCNVDSVSVSDNSSEKSWSISDFKHMDLLTIESEEDND